MLIIPSIDLRQGQCVRLRQGQFDAATIYSQTPTELAKLYVKSGAKRLHIIDLDGAESGELKQLSLINSLRSDLVSIQVGGGIRSIATARACADAGIERIVLGSIAVSDPQLTLQILEILNPVKIVLAIDVNMVDGIPKPAIHGWKTSTEQNLWEITEFYQQFGVMQILTTNIACDGMMTGPNFSLYQEAVERFPNIAWQASGGIRNVTDILQLKDLGVSAAILGRMLYETDFDLSACIQGVELC